MKLQYKGLEGSLNLLFQRTFFLIFPLFQKYLKPQVRTNKILSSFVYHPCPSRLASRIYPFKFLKTPYLSPECLLNFLWLAYSTMRGKNLKFMVFTFLENALNLYIFPHGPVPHSKIQAEFFENLFPPIRKRQRKIWLALSKFN